MPKPLQTAPTFSRLQQRARDAFAAHGWPNRKNEDWHYTDLSARLPADFPPVPDETAPRAEAAQAPRFEFGLGPSLKLNFVDGRLSEQPDLPAGLTLADLAAHPELMRPDGADGQDFNDPVLNANLACLETGLVIDVGDGFDMPLEINVYNNAPEKAAFLRLVFRVHEGGSLTLLETHTGRGQTCLVSDFHQAPGSVLHHLKVLQADSAQTSLLLSQVGLAAGARHQALCLSLSGGFARLETRVSFNEAGSEAGLATAVLAGGRQHVDVTTKLDHVSPDTSSETLARTILDDEACGVFQGKVVVHEDAQRVEASQKSDALLLSADAMMNVKPELEIYADDVACAHGSAIGEIDRDALFFLRSRGIGEEAARMMLVEGFLAEIMDRVKAFPSGDELHGALSGGLAARLGKGS